MSFKDFIEKQKIFNVKDDRTFLYTELYKGPLKRDKVGYVYVYYAEKDQEIRDNGDIMFIKVGRSKHLPDRRIQYSMYLNKDTYIKITDFYSRFHKFLEKLIHKYFKQNRAYREELKDGRTEWFLITEKELLEGIKKIRLALIDLFGEFSEKDRP